MRAIKINPYDQTVTEIEFPNNKFEHFYREMSTEGRPVTVIERATWLDPPNTDLWVDEEGLFKGSKPFRFDNYTFVGIGILTSSSASMNLPARVTLEQIKSMVQF